jgi:hypothetical protein
MKKKRKRFLIAATPGPTVDGKEISLQKLNMTGISGQR